MLLIFLDEFRGHILEAKPIMPLVACLDHESLSELARSKCNDVLHGLSQYGALVCLLCNWAR